MSCLSHRVDINGRFSDNGDSFLARFVGERFKVGISVSFAVHKSVLTSRSEVFEAMLNGPSGNLESSTNRLVMDDVKPEVLKEFLRFLYTDQVRNSIAYSRGIL